MFYEEEEVKNQTSCSRFTTPRKGTGKGGVDDDSQPSKIRFVGTTIRRSRKIEAAGTICLAGTIFVIFIKSEKKRNFFFLDILKNERNTYIVKNNNKTSTKLN